MKIAVWHNLPSGGGKRQLYYHVKGLVERGHYLESWCPDTANQNFLPLGNIIKENIIPLEIKSNRRISYDILKNSHDVKYLINVMDRHCQKCARQINDREFDILFANSCTFLRTSAIAKYTKLPSAIYLNEAYRWFYEALPELPWIAPGDLIHKKDSLINAIKHYLQKKNKPLDGLRIQARQELEYARTFDEILSNSIFSRESILKAYNLESKVCYLGVDTGFYKPTGEKKENFVVGLGTIYHAKGIDRAIRAVAAIEKKRPPLIWIGNGAWDHDLNRYIRLAQESKVEFIPKINIPDKEVISLLSRASAMIYTSRLEPFGLAPLEANACGTAVVAIAEGGVKETVKNGINGYLIKEDNPGKLGELLLQLVGNPGMAVDLGNQARKYVSKNWDIESCTSNIESCLMQLKNSTNKIYYKKVLKNIGTDFPAPTNDIKMGIDQFDYKRNKLHTRGWAFIDDGQSAYDSRIYILVKDNSTLKTIKAKKCKRPDVTAAYGNEVDYDDAGFIAEEITKLQKPFQAGILIIKNEKESFQIFQK